MPIAKTKNSYLLKLLTLQQDGSGAISAPSNWVNQPPLLEVETDVDEIIRDIQETILQDDGVNQTARWHFFIGSPGNGKSAAIGKLCRNLLQEKKCRILDENDKPIQDLGDSAVPYELRVYEEGNGYASAYIVQDASVVRSPFSPNVNPAKDLLQIIEKVWKRAASLIICTNRGVLEKGFAYGHMDHGANTRPWFKVLAKIVEEDFTSASEMGERTFDSNKRNVFEDVKVKTSYLDNRSLLLGCHTFDQLLQEATNAKHWSVCASCTAKEICPFKANRDWLAESESKQQILRLLKRAEVLSGQVIVFREALAIISFILSGCSLDYHDLHPCEWVQNKADESDIFSLAVRRIYMCLYGSYYPHGLETHEHLKRKQLDALKELCRVIKNEEIETKAAINHVISLHQTPSIDVGVTRILGRDGVIASLDPSREALPSDFYEKYCDSDFDVFLNNSLLGVGTLEKMCASIWKKLEQEIESTTNHWAPEAHWALRRWSSNFFRHLGALCEERSTWANDLDKFAKLLETMKRPHDERSRDENLEIYDLDRKIGELFDSIAKGGFPGTVQLSETVILGGDWIKSVLKPRTDANTESGSMSLSIIFEGGERAVLSALTYLWLTRRDKGKLDHRCFPLDLLLGATDARVRAAAKGGYSRENDNVEITIKTDSNNVFKMMRRDGEALILMQS